MEKKAMAWKTKGMNRDLSVSAFNTEYSFENINLRLSTNEGNTTMSWVNEKGPKKLTVDLDGYVDDYFYGVPIGTAILNDQLVVFSHQEIKEEKYDYIYLFTIQDDLVEGGQYIQGTTLYKGDLGFSISYPIETLVSYEANDIQKVYWTDGLNQPRLINIAASEETRKKWNNQSFDFITTLKLKEFITVEKQLGVEGSFGSGVIQYAFTYYNKYGQESNIFYTTPLNYISYQDRGAAPDATSISNSFKISIANVDTNFDYLRIYSIQRTSLNTTPVVKQLTDISLKGVKDYQNNSLNTVYSEDTNYNLPIDKYYTYRRILTKAYSNSDAKYTVSIGDSSATSFNNTAKVQVIAYTTTDEVTTYESLMSFQEFVTKCMDAQGFDTETEDSDISKNCFNENFYSLIKIEESLDRYMNYLAEQKLFDKDIVGWGLLVEDTPYYGDSVHGMYEKWLYYNYADQKWYIVDENTVPIVEESGITQQYADILTYTDTGTNGSIIDPTELLYKGGENIIVKTLEQKDNTLFLGNIYIQRQYIEDTLKETISSDLKDKIDSSTRTLNFKYNFSSDYKYANQLTGYIEKFTSFIKDNPSFKNTLPCGGFKKGDYYRLGIQFQYKSGKWSNPVYIDDVQQENRFKFTEATDSSGYLYPVLTLPTFTGTLTESTSYKLLQAGYKRARAVVVFPSIYDRICIMQGVVCPTLYTKDHRETDKDLYAQPSWFFRFAKSSNDADWDTKTGTVYPQSTSTLPYVGVYQEKFTEDQLYNADPTLLRQVEIQGSYKTENQFNIDRSFITFHSPELVFEEQYKNMDYTGLKYHQVGYVQVDKTFSDINIQTETPTISSLGAGFVHKSFTHDKSYGIVAGLFYDDCFVSEEDKSNIQSLEYIYAASMKWYVYPWHKNGSLNNDFNRPSDAGARTAVLKKKVISNLRYCDNTIFKEDAYSSASFTTTPQLWSSDEATIIKVNNQIYQGNIDTLLIPDYSDGLYCNCAASELKEGATTPFNNQAVYWKTFSRSVTGADSQGIWINKVDNTTKKRYWERVYNDIGKNYTSAVRVKDSVRMKYKSTPHLVSNIGTSIDYSGENALPVIEIFRDKPTQLFGGTSNDALMANTWSPCGEPVDLDANQGTTVLWEYGDTYYQRWDCLKTYPFTHEDVNQIVEIGSFMLETKINIDGRYDRNRGQVNNLNMSPQNFNLFNPVYSQTDNFFSYKIIDEDSYGHVSYPNQITWTKTKQSGADVDLWTNLTLANTLDLDGDKGAISKLIKQNDRLLAFQDTGIAQILYNENAQIATTTGVPIEIANSQKVQGCRYLTDTVGCSDKWAITSTPSGLYFIDSYEKAIYTIGQSIGNLSSSQGFTTWCKQNIPSSDAMWSPENQDNFVTYYDKTTQDVYFINKDWCLTYSERIGTFTSFYNYDAPYFCNLGDWGIWLSKQKNSPAGEEDRYHIYQHRAGDYCNFFGKEYPFSITLVGNADSQIDKIFSTIDMRTTVDGEGEIYKIDKFNFFVPFDSIEVWNEYQHGIATLKNTISMKHHLYKDNEATIKRKFRMWRFDIPRDNAPVDKEVENAKGIFRTKAHPMNRIRNPWMYLKLTNEDSSSKRTEIHDIAMTYLL